MIAIIMAAVVSIIAGALLVDGIDGMKQNHPDYKGEDFLNWDRKNDDWDKTHTENEL